MKKAALIFAMLLLALALSPRAHANGTFSRDPASAADDLASDSVADEKPSDYQGAADVIAANLRPFQGCFNAEVKKHPGLSARVVVEWRITAAGTVSDARVRKSEIKSAAFDACMRSELSKLKFSPPSPKTAQPFSYPFVFFSDNTEKKY